MAALAEQHLDLDRVYPYAIRQQHQHAPTYTIHQQTQQHRQQPSSHESTATSNIPSVPGEIIEERVRHTNEVRCYEKGQFLGKGGFAKVYAFTELATGQVFAAKVIAKASIQKPRHLAKLKAEISIHRSLRHPGIVGFERYFEDRENVYILLELCNHKSMMELMRRRKRLDEPEARYYSRQIIEALLFMHRRRVIHRDLKLGNVFISDMQCKLGDFGLAAKLSHDGERKRTVCGTPNYIAPEILAGGEAGHSYEVDTWSLGVLIYTLVVGTPPFETHDVKATYQRIRTNTWGFPTTAECPLSGAVKDLVRQMLSSEPSQRPNLADVTNHAWFVQYPTPAYLPSSALKDPIPRDVMNQLCRAPAVPNHIDMQPSARSPLTVRDVNSPCTKRTQLKPVPTGPLASVLALKDNENRGSSFNQIGHTNAQTGSHMREVASSARVAAGIQHVRGPSQVLPDNKRRAKAEEIGDAGERRARKVLRTARTDDHAHIRQRHEDDDAYRRRLDELIAASNREEERMHAPSQGVEQVGGKRVTETAAISTVAPQSADAVPAASPTRRLDANMDLLRLHIGNACGSRSSARGNGGNPDRTSAILANEITPPNGWADATGRPASLVSSVTGNISLGTVWVYTWVDLSKRYGLGYQTTAGVFGAHFNDRSKMTLADDESLWYHQSIDGVSNSVAIRPEDDPASIQAQSDNRLTQLAKKNTLIRYFRSYLRDHHRTGTEIVQQADSTSPAALAFVVRWTRTKNAIAFRMSHGGIQVNFFDHTKLMIWAGEGGGMAASGHAAICYVDASTPQQRHVYSLCEPGELHANPELIHRLRYTAETIFPALMRKQMPRS